MLKRLGLLFYLSLFFSGSSLAQYYIETIAVYKCYVDQFSGQTANGSEIDRYATLHIEIEREFKKNGDYDISYPVINGSKVLSNTRQKVENIFGMDLLVERRIENGGYASFNQYWSSCMEDHSNPCKDAVYYREAGGFYQGGASGYQYNLSYKCYRIQ
jgi:hypothetical protein